MLAPRRFAWPLLTCLLALLCLLAPAEAEAGRRSSPGALDYRLAIPEPTTQYVDIEIAVDDAPGARTSLALPAWTPGSYLIRDFGRHVYEVAAEDEAGKALALRRVDKQTWEVDNQGRGFRLRYRVFANELSVRTSYVDDRFALLNGASLFMYVVGETERGAQIELKLPEGWGVHTALPETETKAKAGATRLLAEDYDQLVDSPLLLGQAQRARFVVAGAELEFVLVAPAGTNADLQRLAADTEKVVRAFARVLNGLPFERYVFLLVADPAGGGGLEHHDSTAMIVRPWIFAKDSGYERVQRLVAHEFFHLWNVKRIHDRVLGPFDYARENYTELLWFHEGFTETMETRALLRAGLISPERYLSQLANAWSYYRSKPGRNHTAIAELSREAWIKAYKPAANHAETTVSYYEKGNLIGVSLDLTLRLRAREHGRRGSIEGLFRRLWAARDPKTGEAAITIDDIVAAASAEAGEDMRWFFDRYVYGTEELPLPKLMAEAGVEVEAARVGADDPRAAVWTGMSGRDSIALLEPESPARAAGLMLDDELIAVDGVRVDSISEANERIADHGLDATVELHLFRGERLETRELKTAQNPHRRWRFELPKDGEDDLELARLRELWLLQHLIR